MKLVASIARAKDRPYLTIGLAISGLMIIWYLSTLLLGYANLSVIGVGKLPDEARIGNLSWDDEHRIILDDYLLSTVTPKLRQALVQAADMSETENLSQESHVFLVSSLEMDQINKVLASTEIGKQLVAEGWDNGYKRGELLYPDPSSLVMVGYNGVAYNVGFSVHPLAFPFDPTNSEFGWIFLLWQALFFGMMVVSAIVLGQTIQGLRRKEFIGGKVDAAFLVCIVAVALFVFSLWYFVIFRVL